MFCLSNNLLPDSSLRGGFLCLLDFDFHSLEAKEIRIGIGKNTLLFSEIHIPDCKAACTHIIGFVMIFVG